MEEKDLLLKLKCTSYKIFIYGAGMVGGLVFSRLLSENISRDRISFVVSHKRGKNASYLGQAVYSIGELASYSVHEFAHIIVATLPNAHKEIIDTLHENQMNDYDVIDSLLFDEMETKYVEEHRKRHFIADCTKDILFMASDNNSTSGAFLCMVDLNKELNERGISTLVVLPAYGNGENLLRENKIEFTYILSKNWLSSIECSDFPDLSENNNAINEVCQLIKKYNVKLVHNNTTYTYVGAVAAQRENIPVIWHLREYIREQGFWFVNEENSMRLINNSSAIIVVSDYIRSCYSGLSLTNTYRIYDGIDLKTYYCKNHKIMEGEKIKILMPGMIVPLKGQKQLLEAALLLREGNYFDFEIAFVGNEDPAYAQELRQFIKENSLENNVTFYGQSDEIFKWYSWADIMITCSRSEAFGRVLAEAQLSGCFVIGADRGATTEIIVNKKTGFLYQYGNIKDLMLKIIEAVKNKEKTCEMAKAGQDRIKGEFSKNRNVDEIVKIYKNIWARQDDGNIL